MCGIAGLYNFDTQHLSDESVLRAMGLAMIHRGPDDGDIFTDGSLGLVSRRLSIVDLSAKARMPFRSQSGRFVIVYNGEVYNYRELAQNYLSSLSLRSHSDTEVIVELYERMGSSVLDLFNGMFAIAIWDLEKKELFLARDRFGIKPLYYYFDAKRFLFASEEKCLFAAGIDCEWNKETFEELLCFRYSAGERTPFVGIKRLLPGHTLKVSSRGLESRQWWSLADRIRHQQEGDGQLSFEAAKRKFENLLEDSVKYRLISDVPVGLMLSGGLDSSSIAKVLGDMGHLSLQSFTVSFQDRGYDESHLARLVAEKYGLQGQSLELRAADLPRILEEASYFNDEPLIHGNDPHVLALSRFAKSKVKVLISGEGADETLAGYIRYSALRFPSLLRFLLPLTNGLSPVRSRKLKTILDHGGLEALQLFNSANVFPWDLASLGFRSSIPFANRLGLLDTAREIYPGDRMRQTMFVDMHSFLESVLHRNDRMTMAASIECRVPFLDYRLVELSAALPSSYLMKFFVGKRLLRETVARDLPKAVRAAPKWGFGVPWNDYLERVEVFRDFMVSLNQKTWIRELLPEFSLERAGADLKRQLFFLAHWENTTLPRFRGLAAEARRRFEPGEILISNTSPVKINESLSETKSVASMN